MVKNLPAMRETGVRFLDWEDSLEKGMSTHFSSLAWRILWTEEPGGGGWGSYSPQGRKGLDTAELLTLSLFLPCVLDTISVPKEHIDPSAPVLLATL